MAQAGAAWSPYEIDVIVDSYFRMLESELRGEAYVKSHENKRVHELIGRSRGSIEMKYMNISAALLELRMVPIRGYKPARNLQHALRVAVRDHVEGTPSIPSLMEKAVLQDVDPAIPTSAVDLHFGPVPEIEFDALNYEPHFAPRSRDFVDLERRNRSLGAAGEIVVLNFEKRRLQRDGRADLAERVEHVSRTIGDGLGFDILSFDTRTGHERHLEVKTTRQGDTFPFYVSRNEVAYSKHAPEKFELIRLHDFESKKRGAFRLPGNLEESCRLDATQFVARPKPQAS